MIDQKVIDWLLAGEPWVQYNTRLNLLAESPASLKDLKAELIAHPQVQKILQELYDWPGVTLSSHRSAAQLFHKLSLLADFGLTKDDKEIDTIIKKVREHVSKEGLFQIKTNIPEHYGGDGQTHWAWSLCDAPLTLYSLLKFGYRDAEIARGVSYILSIIRANGWPCKVCDELGSFRGPGRKDDPCPFATLATLKMLSPVPEYINSNEAKTGVETLLELWQNSKTQHPYIFYMGTDFRKLKAPLFWYEILNVANVLSKFNYTHKDKRFLEMLAVIESKKTEEGKYIPESVYREFKDYDFGQKKEPSRWITYNVLKIQNL